ncbi:MAG: hypothetical protein JXQ66_05825 [Campylobacterales bacterium]|nr:hypothetical protein [Campylobacterales bacterium]
MNINLSSKAKTLEQLKNVITNAEVLPLLRFKAFEYQMQKSSILKECFKLFGTNLIVRSSSANEDNLQTSNAGGFDSVLDVKLDEDAIDDAIKKVIASYDTTSDKDEVFIQPMLKNVTMHGVVFTSDIDTLSPYYIINYDTSGSTSKVTEGSSNELKTLVVFKGYQEIKDKNVELLLKASKECEEIFDNNFLDIEFAFSDDKLCILQVRAIVKNKKTDLSSVKLEDSLEKIYKKIKKLNIEHPKLLGKKTIFGVMPDWNPAEIIGVKPKRLALSLYKELITDKIWAYQRDNYGYRNLRSFPLLVSFLGVPFIDVRVSFNSFIPKKLNEKIASKLVDYYIDELSCNTTYHDKVEFEIVYSCYFFGISKRLKVLEKNGFNKNEIKRIEFSLLEVTNNIIDSKNGLYKKDTLKIEKLKSNYETIVNSSLSLIDKIYWLNEDCKRYGTLPFAGVARAAFIAVQFLNSMVEESVITKDEYDKFLNSLNTVSKQLNKDRAILDKKEFLDIYGHLRPGTYDITSKRYDEDFENYFSLDANKVSDEDFTFCDEKKQHIQKLLDENGIDSNASEFIGFLKEAIEGREYLKFVFTKHLSKILLYIEELGLKHNISREDLAYLDIQKILNLYSTLDHRDVKDILETDIQKNREFFDYTKAIKLPSLILNEDDIYKFYLEKDEPNFVTQKSIQAKVVQSDYILKTDLKNTIVCIKSADPGYDYLFTKNIAGLITCYGGANSHMAIRCAELGIPAVIGCGESSFSIFEKANIITIDALNKQVKILS